MRHLVAVAFVLTTTALPAKEISSPALARFPNSDGTHIVFSARGHLWTVPVAGGRAHALTTGAGMESAPRYSPDGRWVAFTGDKGGQQDVYVMPASGGTPRRLTWLSVAGLSYGVRRASQEGLVVAWTPDSTGVVFLSRRTAPNGWPFRPYVVPVLGGPPVPLPVDRSGYLSFGPDGQTLALNRIFSDFRTWKRYTGGLQQDIELFNPVTRSLQSITDWKGNDSVPMWVGKQIYFLSDHDAHRRVNLWAYDTVSRQTRALTHFDDYDIDIPSAGGGLICFQQGGRLWTFDTRSEKLKVVPVDVPDDGSRTAPRQVQVSQVIRDKDTDYDTDYRLSPDGMTALFSARGEIFTNPVRGGPALNLTQSPDAEEDHPAWSPDGRMVAYTTDKRGEQQLVIRPASGGAERPLTHFESGFLYQPLWSPDGRFIAIFDAAHQLWLVPVKGGSPRKVAYNRDHYMHETHEHDVAFLPDGRWLAFSLSRPTRLRALHLYEVATGQDHVLSQSDESDYRPAFSPDGAYLYFVSDRHVEAVQSDRETNALPVKSSGLLVASLDASTPPAFDATGKPARHAPAHPGWVDPAHFMERAVPVPVTPSEIVSLVATPDALLYQTNPPDTLGGKLSGEQSALHRLDLASGKDTTAYEGLDSFVASANGQRVLLDGPKGWTVLDPAVPAKATSIDVSHLSVTANPRLEWTEMFDNVWRLERDQFVNRSMNGVDWSAVRAHYRKLLPLVGTRDDLNYLLGQVVGELGSSHTYVGGGDDGQVAAPAPTPRLGADLSLDEASGRYRIKRIFTGDNTRAATRSPLTWPGVDVHEGDYLLAIAGHPLIAPATPESLLEGLSGPVQLDVAASPTGAVRTVRVLPVQSEGALRQLAWTRRNADIVDRLSNGRVGYIDLPDMLDVGMEQFVRGFYAQLGKEALVIDDRWNGGGNTDQMVLERLRRTLSSMQTMRDRVPQTQPDQVQTGPKAMLINHYSASDGDVFPFHFRQYGLGKLVGTRTWGGVRGIRTFWSLLDGGYVTIPEITFSTLSGQWMLENQGNAPDIDVEEQPWEFDAGNDSQLEAAVQELLKELPMRRGPPTIAPDVPVYASSPAPH